MPKKKSTTPLGTSEIANSTALNPEFTLGVDTDIFNPSGKDYIEGESVDEHHIIEQANEYLAEEELKQEYNNL
ncbi:hypothetical protein [Bacillus sp. Marseille-P3661]|uniref:hypothetical protein n=1 Tax=Bacillus sp. Marseille-P3661 TaxID=1936234 RepID=UPI000C846CDE|nr:hypothetical protein [Bacillus sp. Marseille-P3661]